VSWGAWGFLRRIASDFPKSQDPDDGAHLQFAGGTKGSGLGRRGFVGTQDKRDAGVEGNAFARGFGGGVAVAITANGAHSDWQDMAQVAGNELYAGERFGALGIGASTVFPGKSDRSFADCEHAGVSDGRSANINAQILNDALAIAEGLKVHAPIFFPNRRLHSREGCVFRELPQGVEFFLEATTEGGAEHGLWHQERGAFDADDSPRCAETSPRNDAMNVGVEKEALVPSMKDHGEPALMSTQPARIGKGSRQGLRRCGKEDLIDVFGGRGKKEPAKLLGQREGDHEVGSPDPLGEFTLDPIRRVLFATLRAGAVIAGMKSKVGGATLFASMDMPTHCRRATIGERPERTAPCPIHNWMLPEEVG